MSKNSFFKKLSIRGKLNFLFIIITTIPLSIISFFIIYQTISIKRDESLRNVKNEIYSIKEKTNLLLARVNSEISLLSKSSPINNINDIKIDYTKKDSIDNSIIDLFKNGLYFKIEVLDRNAKKISSVYFDSISSYITPSSKLIKKPLIFYKDIISDMNHGELKLSPSEVKSPINEKIIPSIDCIYPVFKNNEVFAIIIASIQAENLFKLFSISNRDSSIKIVLCNGEGYYLYHSIRKNNWNNLLATRLEENLKHDYGVDIADSILNGKTGTIFNFSSNIIEYTQIFNQNSNAAKKYVLFTEIPSSIVFKPVNDLLFILIVLFAIIFIISIWTSIFASKLFTKPINKLIEGTKIIKNGNLDYKIQLNTNDEIEDLAINFNELVVHWKEKRELEEKQRYEDDLAERKKYLENIISNMGHEIRTPMIGIMGFSKMLPKLQELDEIKEIGDSIYQSSKRLMDTLNLIIDIAKLESGEYLPFISIIDLYESIYMVTNTFEISAKEKGLSINIKSEYSNIYLKSDLNAVQSILTCLLDNALKFTEKGQINLYLNSFNKEGTDWISISVEDTGIGIPEENFENIFIPFKQGSEGLSRNYEGTGLGLALSKKYAEILGGKIYLKSKINQGSTFTLELPNKELTE